MFGSLGVWEFGSLGVKEFRQYSFQSRAIDNKGTIHSVKSEDRDSISNRNSVLPTLKKTKKIGYLADNA